MTPILNQAPVASLLPDDAVTGKLHPDEWLFHPADIQASRRVHSGE